MFKHIIWDFDGTLYNTYPGLAKTFQETLRKFYNIDLNYYDILDWSRISLNYCGDRITEKYGLVKEELMDNFSEQYVNEGPPIDEPPYPGGEEVCMEVQRKGGLNLLVTHRSKNTLIRLLKKYQMIDYFTELISGDDDFPRKPDPSSFKYLIDKYNLDQKEVLAIGDRLLDIEAARNAGINSCYFDPEKENKLKADYHIHSLNEILELLY